MPTNIDIIDLTNIELVKLNTKISDLYKPGAKEFLCDISNSPKVSVYLDPYNTPDIIYIFGVPKITNNSFTNHVLLYKNITGKPIIVPLEIKNYKYLYITINKNSTISGNQFTFSINTTTTPKPVTTTPKPVTTTKKPVTTTKKPTITTTKGPNTTVTTTPKPVTTTPAPVIKEIPLNKKVSDIDRFGSNTFSCKVNGLTDIKVVMNPFGVPNQFSIFGIDANNTSVSLFEARWGMSRRIAPLKVSTFKSIQIKVDKDYYIPSNAFEFTVIGDEKLLK